MSDRALLALGIVAFFLLVLAVLATAAIVFTTPIASYPIQ